MIYKATGNLRAAQILLGHTKIDKVVTTLGFRRTLGMEAIRCRPQMVLSSEHSRDEEVSKRAR